MESGLEQNIAVNIWLVEYVNFHSVALLCVHELQKIETFVTSGYRLCSGLFWKILELCGYVFARLPLNNPRGVFEIYKSCQYISFVQPTEQGFVCKSGIIYCLLIIYASETQH